MPRPQPRLPRSSARPSAWLRPGALLVALITASLLVAGQRVIVALGPLSPGAETRLVFEVSRNQNGRELSRRLQEAGIIPSAELFYWYGRITGAWSRVKTGEYELSPASDAQALFEILASGQSIQRPVTIPEGSNIHEIGEQLEARGLASRERFVALCRDPAFIGRTEPEAAGAGSLEGYLHPETYFFTKATTAEEIARLMAEKARSIWGERERARAAELGLTRHEVLTLASMVEKETGAAHERPMISSVFHNRLKKRMRLQSDPTTIYGIWERFAGNLTKADLATRTPYNTYAMAGLPTGPIANPGKEAIQAALFPAESEYLFFVSHNDGTHEFTRTYAEHLQAVRRFQLDPSARAGKSWRDLRKTTR
jgi:UPF0755 protein